MVTVNSDTQYRASFGGTSPKSGGSEFSEVTAKAENQRWYLIRQGNMLASTLPAAGPLFSHESESGVTEIIWFRIGCLDRGQRLWEAQLPFGFY